jgi:alpha/beta superfamily hydrolase
MFVDFATPPRQPVLDVVAEHDFPDVLALTKSRAARLRNDRCSASLVIPRADHYFGNAAAGLSAAIAPFLARAFARDCG